MSFLRRRRLGARSDAGFSMIEMLVATVLLASLGTLFLASILGAQKSERATASEQDLNEEARLALNRMARELRQATAISAAVNPDGTNYDVNATTYVTFTADFDGDGCIDGVKPASAPSYVTTCNAYNSANPETLTYCWDPSASVRQLYLIPGTLSGTSCHVTGAEPILAGQVTAFKLSYRSNGYLYDSSGDGITTWSEVDSAGSPVGNQDGTLNQPELSNIDSVVIDLTVAAGGTAHTQIYETQVDLRNLS